MASRASAATLSNSSSKPAAAQEESELVQASRAAAIAADEAAAAAADKAAQHKAAVAATVATHAGGTGRLVQVPVCCNPHCPRRAGAAVESEAAPVPEPEPEQEASAAADKATKLQRCSKCKAVQYCGRECQLQHWPVHKRVCVACKYSQRLLQLFAHDEDYQATLVGFKHQFEASDDGGRHAVGLICDSVATVKAMCDKDSLSSGGVKVDIKDFSLEDLVQGGLQNASWAGPELSRQWLTAQAFTERYDMAAHASLFVQVTVEEGVGVLIPACVQILTQQ